ncbi:hypothetical protein B0T16DRAFT_407570 [Cercophora newfieldiana]|uniref:Uncharacterized protein n=1 Tax=Cercophora newfieldiana TaxID=92897 RepID=A0AA39Y8Q1_9PEZI|nr:hypothetical protein B0T16DRAFT_407570 [Cercophora newfieldiana]
MPLPDDTEVAEPLLAPLAGPQCINATNRSRKTRFNTASSLPWLAIAITSLFWVTVFSVAFAYRSATQCDERAGDFGRAHHLENGTSHRTIFSNYKYSIHCGNSPEAARRAGCQYDMLSNYWVPEACMDNNAVAEYQSDGSWHPFLDENHTVMLSSPDEMGSVLGGFYYTSIRDHIIHCASLWKKQFRVWAEAREAFDAIVADEEHTMHCAQFLVDMTDNGPDYREIPIKVFVGYATCWVRV